MPVYKILCEHCHFSQNQFLTRDVGSLIIKCPGCYKSVAARKIKTTGVVEAQADGVMGYLRYDNRKHQT